MDQEHPLLWLRSQIHATLERHEEHYVNQEVVEKVSQEIALIMEEWRRRFPTFDLAPGVTIDDLDLDITTPVMQLKVELMMREPRWKVQFHDMNPICQYEEFDVYDHFGFTLAFMGHNKYLVCSEYSAHQEALEVWLESKRRLNGTMQALEVVTQIHDLEDVDELQSKGIDSPDEENR